MSGLFARAGLPGALLGAALSLGVWGFSSGRTSKLQDLEIASDDNWVDAGFVEMVSPISPPTSLDQSDLIEVWLRLPPGRTVDVTIAADGRPLVVLPPGTLADRVERITSTAGAPIVDVRGTEVLPDGGQQFHMLRRVGPVLRGYAWARGSADEQREADARVAELVPVSAVAKLRRLNDCASCHVAQKPEQLELDPAGLPNRRTDVVGFYQVQAVLGDEQPLERSRPRDTNVDDPFITLACPDGGRPQVGSFDDGRREVRCSGTGVPRARYDVAAGLSAGALRALRVCASRRYLHEHMTDHARAAFQTAFIACGLSETTKLEAGSEPASNLERKETASWTRRAWK